jgi:hypothetical protein
VPDKAGRRDSPEDKADVDYISQAARRLEYSSAPAPTSKEELLEIKAAAEERYYSRDIGAALTLAERALLAGDELMHPTEKKELLLLRERCKR